MISVRLLLQVLFAFSCACVALAFPTQFENTKVIRTIDVTTAIAREDVGIRAKNIDSVPASEYYFYVPIVISKNAASISAFLRKQKTELQVVLEDEDAANQMYVYKVILNEPVQPQQDVLLGLKIAYTHTIKPMPTKLPQVARQHTIFAFNSYLLSPYQTIETKTTLQTPSKNIVSHSGAAGKSAGNGNKVVYGPYENVAPLSFDIATCHFENSKPLITITTLERDIEISHWGNNLAVEEHYALRNDGAGLDKDFNRVQYQATAHIHDQTNVLKSLTFDLPALARDPYFRDEVGNVSTSHFRVEKEKSVLELTPRYPLFGGWNYTWYYGYNTDLGQYVHKAKSGKYVLNINFVENVKDMTVDKAIVRVVLPEGATNAKVNTPFAIDQELITKHFTYFDSTGRLMVVLEKDNVVREHELPIQIEYEYSSFRLLQKPIVASAAIFLLFLVSIGLNKLSFTIGKEAKLSKKMQ
ncbi:Ribophorin I [Mucor mucedo]|uniref:Ribophorin I n=1 Tax=Mucor mucedo TaxID=29922 RepID=UPI00222086A9|nr:Ribophorin I [Mucor mucedo]KAI7895853.1 Ribophorin I [Mucor mucedo]